MGGVRTPSRTESLAVPGQAQAQGNRPAEVKRRKSGFGALLLCAFRNRGVRTTALIQRRGRSAARIPRFRSALVGLAKRRLKGTAQRR
jgi:hypothetical protein